VVLLIQENPVVANILQRLITALNSPMPKSIVAPVQVVSTGARRVSDDAVAMIISFENLAKIGKDGLVYAYHDMLGFPTIGVGHLLSRNKWEDLSIYQPITIEDAHILHRNDLDKYAIGVSKLVKIAISDNEFGALVSLAFNVGLGNLGASTLIRKLNRGDSKDDVANEFLKWNKGGGRVIAGLTRRRISERKLFLS
jgi:GH24 family phage-related lysozyme (muramidase)